MTKKTEKQLKLAIFFIFWVKNNKQKKKIPWNISKYNAQVIDEAFGGSWEQQT